ncbi:MAG: HNH endonuclease signature motif containing protein [Pseudomonadota bacterium]
MSKDLARGPESYANEELILELLPGLLEQNGFSGVTTARQGAMKFVDATTGADTSVRFWLKQGWTGPQNYSAIQFGMFESADLPDDDFAAYVTQRVHSARRRGATHALFVHMGETHITNYVALEIDDVDRAYRQQIKWWPERARNTKAPTLWFEDDRALHDAECIRAVLDLELPLASICGVRDAPKGTGVDSKKVTVEMERRMKQGIFRLRVGGRCGWRCAVSGADVRAVLDAAHLPGRNWRFHNEAHDGVLVRTDLHRLLDKGLAEFRDGTFWVADTARKGEYAQLHGRPVHI